MCLPPSIAVTRSMCTSSSLHHPSVCGQLKKSCRSCCINPSYYVRMKRFHHTMSGWRDSSRDSSRDSWRDSSKIPPYHVRMERFLQRFLQRFLERFLQDSSIPCQDGEIPPEIPPYHVWMERFHHTMSGQRDSSIPCQDSDIPSYHVRTERFLHTMSGRRDFTIPCQDVGHVGREVITMLQICNHLNIILNIG